MEVSCLNIVLPPQVKVAIELLEQNGFEAYVVGGCVRDSILGVCPPDWDITTSALPNEVLCVFNKFKTIETGIKHGTVIVIINDLPLEITTFRIDGDYLDNRHPENVKFCSNLREDLSRRDFTINAMAYNKSDGLIDAFDGIKDIKNNTIKCVGNPDLRFNEDALRILRALRFSSVLGFELEQSTDDSVLRNAYLLQNVSKERIATELLKLLCGKNVCNVLLKYRDVIAKIIPEIEPMFDFNQHNKHHIFDVWEHTVYAIGYADCDPIVRLTLLLHDIGKPHCFSMDEKGVGHFYGHGNISADIARTVLKSLKLSNEMSETVLTLVKYHDYPITSKEKIVKRRLLKFSVPIFVLLLKVKLADLLAHNPVYSDRGQEIEAIEKTMNKIIANGECFKLCDLAVNGNDLIELGIPASKKIGEILNELLLCVIDGKLENNKTDLIEQSKKMIRGLRYE